MYTLMKIDKVQIATKILVSLFQIVSTKLILKKKNRHCRNWKSSLLYIEQSLRVDMTIVSPKGIFLV